MDLQTVLEMIETRMQATDHNGNYTEKSLMWEVHKLLIELEQRRNESENSKNNQQAEGTERKS